MNKEGRKGLSRHQAKPDKRKIAKYVWFKEESHHWNGHIRSYNNRSPFSRRKISGIHITQDEQDQTELYNNRKRNTDDNSGNKRMMMISRRKWKEQSSDHESQKLDLLPKYVNNKLQTSLLNIEDTRRSIQTEVWKGKWEYNSWYIDKKRRRNKIFHTTEDISTDHELG